MPPLSLPHQWSDSLSSLSLTFFLPHLPSTYPSLSRNTNGLDIYISDFYIKISHYDVKTQQSAIGQIDLFGEIQAGSEVVEFGGKNEILIKLTKMFPMKWKTLEFEGNKIDKMKRREESIQRKKDKEKEREKDKEKDPLSSIRSDAHSQQWESERKIHESIHLQQERERVVGLNEITKWTQRQNQKEKTNQNTVTEHKEQREEGQEEFKPNDNQNPNWNILPPMRPPSFVSPCSPSLPPVRSVCPPVVINFTPPSHSQMSPSLPAREKHSTDHDTEKGQFTPTSTPSVSSIYFSILRVKERADNLFKANQISDALLSYEEGIHIYQTFRGNQRKNQNPKQNSDIESDSAVLNQLSLLILRIFSNLSACHWKSIEREKSEGTSKKYFSHVFSVKKISFQLLDLLHHISSPSFAVYSLSSELHKIFIKSLLRLSAHYKLIGNYELSLRYLGVITKIQTIQSEMKETKEETERKVVKEEEITRDIREIQDIQCAEAAVSPLSLSHWNHKMLLSHQENQWERGIKEGKMLLSLIEWEEQRRQKDNENHSDNQNESEEDEESKIIGQIEEKCGMSVYVSPSSSSPPFSLSQSNVDVVSPSSFSHSTQFMLGAFLFFQRKITLAVKVFRSLQTQMSLVDPNFPFLAQAQTLLEREELLLSGMENIRTWEREGKFLQVLDEIHRLLQVAQTSHSSVRYTISLLLNRSQIHFRLKEFPFALKDLTSAEGIISMSKQGNTNTKNQNISFSVEKNPFLAFQKYIQSESSKSNSNSLSPLLQCYFLVVTKNRRAAILSEMGNLSDSQKEIREAIQWAKEGRKNMREKDLAEGADGDDDADAEADAPSFRSPLNFDFPFEFPPTPSFQMVFSPNIRREMEIDENTLEGQWTKDSERVMKK